MHMLLLILVAPPFALVCQSVHERELEYMRREMRMHRIMNPSRCLLSVSRGEIILQFDEHHIGMGSTILGHRTWTHFSSSTKESPYYFPDISGLHSIQLEVTNVSGNDSEILHVL